MISCNKQHLGGDLYEGSILFTSRDENATICGYVSRICTKCEDSTREWELETKISGDGGIKVVGDVYEVVCVVCKWRKGRMEDVRRREKAGGNRAARIHKTRKRESPLRPQLLLTQMMKQPNPARPLTHYFNPPSASLP